MKTTTMQPVHLYVPITRVNDEERIVEGYAFVNETVDGEGGVRLLRSAMEAATDDYMQWGAVREMHQPSAVGTALADGCGITWDDKGAKLRAKIVDDAAWKKVKEGVYRGFSLGASPQLVRGKDVTKVKWVENSLVDRPKDPDCPFTVWRAEGVDPEAPVEVEVLEEAPEERAETDQPAEEPTESLTEAPAGEVVPEAVTEEPATEESEEEQRGETITLPADWTAEDVDAFNRWAGLTPNSAELVRALTSSDVPSRENLEGPKGDTHYSCGAEGICHGHTTRGGAQECMERQAQGMDEHISALEEHLNGLKAKRRAEQGEEDAVERVEAPADLPDPATDAPSLLLERVESIPADQLSPFTTTILTRLEAAESGLAEERQKRTAAEERAETLAKQPAVVAPVRFPQALERTQAHLREQYPDLSKLDDEIKRAEASGIAARNAGDEAEAIRCVDHLQRLKMQRAALVPAQS